MSDNSHGGESGELEEFEESTDDLFTTVSQWAPMILAILPIYFAWLRIDAFKGEPNEAYGQTTLNYLLAAAVFLVWPAISKFKGFGVELEKTRRAVRKAERVATEANRTAADSLALSAQTSGILIPDVAVATTSKNKPATPINARRAAVTAAKAIAFDPEDPHLGIFGGQRENQVRRVSVGPIRPLNRLSRFFNVPLRVEAIQGAPPLQGVVRFHLHPSFTPDVQDVEAKNGVATLNLVSYGAFTIGVETDFQNTDANGRLSNPDTSLEIRLWDKDIDAPETFKER